MKPALINLVCYQCVWFLAVLGAVNDHYWMGALGLTGFIIAHYYFSDTAGADYVLAIFAVLTGLAIETTFMRTGLLIYTGVSSPFHMAPIWMLILWANFALIMNGCLRWLQQNLFLSAFLGFLGGPLTYLAGFKLGAATPGVSSPIVLLIIAISYALITPMFLIAARHLPNILKSGWR